MKLKENNLKVNGSERVTFQLDFLLTVKVKTRLANSTNIMLPEFFSNIGYVHSCFLYKLKSTGIL